MRCEWPPWRNNCCSIIWSRKPGMLFAVIVPRLVEYFCSGICFKKRQWLSSNLRPTEGSPWLLPGIFIHLPKEWTRDKELKNRHCFQPMLLFDFLLSSSAGREGGLLTPLGNASLLWELETWDGFHLLVAPRVCLVLASGCTTDKGRKKENIFMFSIQWEVARLSDFLGLYVEFIILGHQNLNPVADWSVLMQTWAVWVHREQQELSISDSQPNTDQLQTLYQLSSLSSLMVKLPLWFECDSTES